MLRACPNGALLSAHSRVLYLAISHSQEARFCGNDVRKINADRKELVLTFSTLYAGTIRMLRSTACGECVSAPTEM